MMALAVTLAAGGADRVVASTPVDARPNVVLLMADDLGWGDTGYNGHPMLRTPNLDEMSAAGLRFDRFYAAAPVCSPTRGSVLTGRHPLRYGIFSANDGHLRDEEISLAEVLRDQGYRTGHFGKWHLGTLLPDFSGKGPRRNPEKNFSTPAMNGFEEWFSTEFTVASWDPYAPAHQVAGKEDGTVDPRVLYWHNGRNVSEPLRGDDSRIILDRAIPFIEGAVAERRPFFAVIWFHAPHGPVIGGPEYRKLYPKVAEPEQHYYAAITAMDEQVGRLRRRLRQLGVARNTMIWFCSDNGPDGLPGPRQRFRGSAGPFRGRKWSLYEGGVRVPGILEWPERIATGRATDFPAVTSDLFPTVLGALGVPLPAGRPYDGISLLPVIDGEGGSRRPGPIAFRFGKQASLHDNRYKLVVNSTGERRPSDNGTAPIARYELYDLIDDPSETRNIASGHPQLVLEMRRTLAQWESSCRSSRRGQDYPPAAASPGSRSQDRKLPQEQGAAGRP